MKDISLLNINLWVAIACEWNNLIRETIPRNHDDEWKKKKGQTSMAAAPPAAVVAMIALKTVSFWVKWISVDCQDRREALWNEGSRFGLPSRMDLGSTRLDQGWELNHDLRANTPTWVLLLLWLLFWSEWVEIDLKKPDQDLKSFEIKTSPGLMNWLTWIKSGSTESWTDLKRKIWCTFSRSVSGVG